MSSNSSESLENFGDIDWLRGAEFLYDGNFQ